MLTLIYGGITHHYLSQDLPYCNTINSKGSIHNEYGIILIGEKTKVGLLKGVDSACGSIWGPISSFQLSENVDFMLGGYNTNFKEFRNRGIEPPSFAGVTPVVGLDFKIPLYRDDDIKISLDNLVSVGIITHAISVNF